MEKFFYFRVGYELREESFLSDWSVGDKISLMREIRFAS